MPIQIFDWKSIESLSIEEKNTLHAKLLKRVETYTTTTFEQELFEELLEHLENEYWECECCHIFFYKDAHNLRYDPTRCDTCIKDDITFFGISYYKADRGTRHFIKDALRREEQVEKGFGYYGL